MKKLWIYFVAVSAAVLTVACEKTEVDGYAAGEGGVVMNLANTRAVDMSGRTLADCTTSIYQKGTDAETSEPTETLIREYAPGKCPETIKLLAGSYFVKVQWGEQPAAAAFDKCFYEGSEDFTITAGQTEQVTVRCKPQSTAVDVVFEESIAEKLSDYSAVVALFDDNDPNTTDALTFTESETGYFTMPKDVTKLTWTFDATHPEKGEVRKSGEITGVEAGKSYKLTFKYSRDLPGYVSVDISVDDTTKDYNDVMVFSQDPEVTWGEQNFTNETLPDGIDVTITGKKPITEARIYLEGENTASPASTRAGNESEIWTWTVEGGASDETIATATLSDDKKTLTITLKSHEILPSGADGSVEASKSNFRFEVEDEAGGQANKVMPICIDGLCPISTKDYDLWTNTVTLRAISSKGEPTFKLQQTGENPDEWEPVKVTEVTKTSECEYTAKFAAEWTEWPGSDSDSPNANGLTVYTPVEGTGVWAGHTYEAAVEIGEKTYDATFTTDVNQPIPNGNMAKSDLSCFTENNKTAEFWGSGNNGFADKLCAQGTTESGHTYACLKSTMAGAMGITMLASGNLFTGTFYRPSTTGTVSFGQDYDWKARPTALSLKYHATVGTVNQQKHKKNGANPLNIGDQDKGIIYVAIVDWTKPHDVSSGISAPTGTWSPDEKVNPGEGPIIGYGIFIIDKSTDGNDLQPLEIPIYYYDKKTKPSGKYKLVISCATNIYGDYMCGCDSNELWVTDFKWVY